MNMHHKVLCATLDENGWQVIQRMAVQRNIAFHRGASVTFFSS